MMGTQASCSGQSSESDFVYAIREESKRPLRNVVCSMKRLKFLPKKLSDFNTLEKFCNTNAHKRESMDFQMTDRESSVAKVSC